MLNNVRSLTQAELISVTGGKKKGGWLPNAFHRFANNNMNSL
ncbi:hypothetical protein [uncultured Secundilactobacillus sp.]|nr:hypothetical protein [uncultured Secundilactobacillus sp.]